ncbi:MAG: isopeptide-forming domain-containing fimbrial protein [Actinoallomurus sp.]
MLAALISTFFALPAQAAPGELEVMVTGPAGPVLPGASVIYTITVTNNTGATSTAATLTDTLTNGAFVGTPTDDGLGLGCAAPVSSSTICDLGDIADQAVVTVTVTTTAGSVGTETNTVSLVGDVEVHPSSGTLVANSSVENADLVVTKTHTGITTPGGALTYTLTVHNLGPSDATSVTLNDTAPANITFGSVTVASVPVGITTCSAASTTAIACLFASIPNGMTVTVTVPATLSVSAVVGTSISNTASTSTATLDATAGNNSSTDTFVVGAASVDLGVTLTVLPTTAAPGDTVTYTVTVTNPDTVTDATNVVVTDMLPTGLTPVTPPTAPSAGIAAVVGSTWTWTIPTVAKAAAAGTPTTVTATFDAVVDLDTLLPTITNTVTMTLAQTDPTPANNTASADLTVTAAVADLDVLTAVDNAKPNQGDTIAIAIQVSNAGPADATNVVLKDVLPKGLKYVSCTPCNPTGLRRSTSHQFSIALIPANSAATLVLNVTVQASSGTLKNTATIVSSDQTDPINTNDKDTLQITIGGTNNSGGGGGSGGTSGGTAGAGGTTAFTGFTAGQLMPWFLLLFSVGLAAIELGRRRTLVSPIGFTYGFEPPF